MIRSHRVTRRRGRIAPRSMLLLSWCLLLGAASLRAQATGTTSGALALTLPDAVERAQRDGFRAQAARATRDAARQRDRAFVGGQRPQLALGGNLPVYNRSIIPVLQPDGSTVFRPQQQAEAALTMQVTQRIPGTGGDLFVSSALSRLDVSGDRTFRTWSSTPLLVGLRQDILRPNRQRWDNREQALRLQIAERTYTEALEAVAVEATNAFFDHYTALVGLQNATTNVAVNDTLYTLNQGRFEVGRIGENDLLQSELALLRAQNAVAAARLTHDRTLAALRLALGLPPDVAVRLEPPTAVPAVTVDTIRAVREALANRAAIAELELGDVQAERRIAEARLGNGPGASLQASIGFNQTGPEAGAVYQDLRQAQRVALAVQVPVIQWGARSGQVEAARADQRGQEFRRSEARERTVQEAHFAALELELASRQLALAAKADTVGSRRFEVAKNRYVIGRIGIDNLYQAQTEKDAALQEWLRALRGYWVAYYTVRRVTLYDFARNAPVGR